MCIYVRFIVTELKASGKNAVKVFIDSYILVLDVSVSQSSVYMSLGFL